MGDVHSHPPVLMLVAAFSRYPAALDWGREQLESKYGPVVLTSPAFDFVETNYYEASMGAGIKKVFWIFEKPLQIAELPALKLWTNDLESQYAGLGNHPESRPLNLDPGYMTAAKLVLASTKDHAHRIYLDIGIFAEVTLYFKDGRWQHRDWTFPDYRREDYQKFFLEARQLLKRRGLP